MNERTLRGRAAIVGVGVGVFLALAEHGFSAPAAANDVMQLGDPLQPVTIGTEVDGVFEHHAQNDPPYSLLQWRQRRPSPPLPPPPRPR